LEQATARPKPCAKEWEEDNMAQSTISNIGKSMASIESKIGTTSSQISKGLAKSEGVTKLPHVAPTGMKTHVAVEHGIRPPAHAGNAATTGQANAYSLPN
jgi:hypothetical protein